MKLETSQACAMTAHLFSQQTKKDEQNILEAKDLMGTLFR